MLLVTGLAAIINIQRGALDPPRAAAAPSGKSLPDCHLPVIRL
jgi:hypothetical protein